jgi:hypothetical protein
VVCLERVYDVTIRFSLVVMAVPRKSPLPPSSADLAQEYRIACHKKAGVTLLCREKLWLHEI